MLPPRRVANLHAWPGQQQLHNCQVAVGGSHVQRLSFHHHVSSFHEVTLRTHRVLRSLVHAVDVNFVLVQAFHHLVVLTVPGAAARVKQG
jgi:hypothetical protein